MKVCDRWSRFSHLKNVWDTILNDCDTPEKALYKLANAGPHKGLPVPDLVIQRILYDTCTECNEKVERTIIINHDWREDIALCGNCLIKALQLFEDET